MKILVASDPGPNPYVGSLVCELNDSPSVSSVMSGAILFWMLPKEVDVLHLQWPEALFPGGRQPTDAELDKLARQLARWKDRARVVATVHNRIPHRNQTHNARKLYATVYERCDGIVHLGARSVEAFKEDFPQLTDQRHTVITHGNYAFFDNEVSRTQARQWLGIADDSLVVLAFGQLRHAAEGRCLWHGFRRFRQPSKLLLVAGRIAWPHGRVLKAYQRLRRLIRGRILVHNRHITDLEVQYFLNASDIVVIPRVHQLNSGNVVLGFTFGKVVVGPDTGVIGELLNRHGNPTYVPGDPNSLAEALEAAVDLVAQGKGLENRQTAFTDWSWPKVAEEHLQFYGELVARPVASALAASKSGG